MCPLKRRRRLSYPAQMAIAVAQPVGRIGACGQQMLHLPVTLRSQPVLPFLPVDLGERAVDDGIVGIEPLGLFQGLRCHVARPEAQVGRGKVGQVDAVLWTVHHRLDETNEGLVVVLPGEVDDAQGL